MSDARHLVRRVLDATGAEQVRAAARLMSLIADDADSTPQVLADLHGAAEPRMVLGFTGPPGVGKSTLVDALVHEWRQASPDRKIGVIAVDPTSPATGGALLGDRVRMMRHAADDGVFIRSLATRGRHGGLTAGIAATVRVLGALSCHAVLIETVGVGQTEVDVQNAVDVVIVVLSAGYGDDIQLHKAGLLEVGDVFVVNKADLPGADEFASSLEAMLAIGREAARGASDSARAMHRRIASHEHTTVSVVSAATGAGVRKLVEVLEQRGERAAPQWIERRRAVERDAVNQAVLDRAVARVVRVAATCNHSMDCPSREAFGESSINAAVRELLRRAAGDERGGQGQHE